jgi:hypothetical protein
MIPAVELFSGREIGTRLPSVFSGFYESRTKRGFRNETDTPTLLLQREFALHYSTQRRLAVEGT